MSTHCHNIYIYIFMECCLTTTYLCTLMRVSYNTFFCFKQFPHINSQQFSSHFLWHISLYTFFVLTFSRTSTINDFRHIFRPPHFFVSKIFGISTSNDFRHIFREFFVLHILLSQFFFALQYPTFVVTFFMTIFVSRIFSSQKNPHINTQWHVSSCDIFRDFFAWHIFVIWGDFLGETV